MDDVSHTRVLGDEQCCELGCNGGACETCPCCCAGWCVLGTDFHAGTPDSLEGMSAENRQIWLSVAAMHNPLAAHILKLEAVPDEASPGLYDKYVVWRVNDHTGKHVHCEYFVLDPTHDPLAREALATYIGAAYRDARTELATDLVKLLERSE